MNVDHDDPGYEMWLANLAKECECCPNCWGRPCGGCQQGAPCDQARCRCWDECDDEFTGSWRDDVDEANEP